MIANYLIGLREGLEAALIVGILAAYLIKIGKRDQFKTLFTGVGTAIIASIALGFALTYVIEEAPAGTAEIIAGSASIVAVGFATYMIFWMATQAKRLSGDLRAKVDSVKDKTMFGIAALAFFAVLREGFETAIFIWSAAKSTGDDTNPILGAVLGLLTATWLGYLIYRGALKLNLSKFFAYTGAYLVIVAAGILAYAIHEFQEIGFLQFLTASTYDVSHIVVKGEWLDTILRGALSFRAAPSQLESLVWFAYLIPTTIVLWKKSRTKFSK